MIDSIKYKDLLDFADFCSNIIEFSKDIFINEALKCKRISKGSKDASDISTIFKEIEGKWYNSIKKGKPDYSVYDNINILQDLWACWCTYSRSYLKNISSRGLHGKSVVDDIGDIKGLLDLGCGIGYSTIVLKELFPDSFVYGYNIKNSFQYKICNKLSENYGFTMVSDLSKLKDIDFVFASEYFEHYERPIEHLRNILFLFNPKYLIIANSFTSTALGHFINYHDKDNTYDGRRISRLFNDELRKNNYQKLDTGFWNNRPTYWRKK